jgi:hypothetical protein
MEYHMPVKTYSLPNETIGAINALARQTHRTQSAIIDIAVAELVKKNSPGDIDLSAVLPVLTRRQRLLRKSKLKKSIG